MPKKQNSQILEDYFGKWVGHVDSAPWPSSFDWKELLLKALPSGLEHKVTQVSRGSKAIRGLGSSGVRIQRWHCSRKIYRRHWTLSFWERERGWRRVIEKMCWSERKSVYIMCLCCVCVRKWYRENARTRHNHAHNPPLTTTQNSRTIRGKKKVMIANQKPKSKNPTKFAPISHTPISSQLPSANTQYATDRNKK